MTTTAIEIIKDLAFFIAYGYCYGVGSNHLIDYLEFSHESSIDFTLAEVYMAYDWLVKNGYIYEYASDRNSDSPFYWNVGLTKKAWKWIEESNTKID